MNFPTHIDQVIHDHQHALHAEARAHRLARPARASRQATRRAARREGRRCETAGALIQIGVEVDRLVAAPIDPPTERTVSRLLVAATVALEAPALSVGLSPIGAGTAPIVAQRWLARLAEHTADRGLHLDAVRTAQLADIVTELRGLSAGPGSPAGTPAPASARSTVRFRFRQAAPARFSGAG